MPLFRGLFVRKDSARGTTPVEARKALAGMVAPLGAVGARPGLLSGGNVTGTAGWAYSVPAFHAVLTRGAADGVVLMGNDGPVTAPTDPSPTTGARIDIVYVRHADVDAGDPTSAPAVDVARGAASGSPQPPSLPAGALELARATVAATALSTQHAGVTITQSALRTALRGTPVPVRDAAERDAYRSAHLAAGGALSVRAPLSVVRDDTGVVETTSGAGWVSWPHGGLTRRFSRAATSDAQVSSGGLIGLTGGTIEGARAGVWRISGRASLYTSGSSCVGAAYVEWASGGGAPSHEFARWDLPNTGGTYPLSPCVERTIVHPGGDLMIGVGYRRDVGAFWVTGASSGLTVVEATYLGLGV
ncbi:hypothetical protein ACFWGN_16115 [Oerskovia sp. NPDC060338]|uniref:hypothetical protein n=1 Tax=Oerskovia sp. NPDC060338 TaxID=3347100 RepID=UPI0036577FA7